MTAPTWGDLAGDAGLVARRLRQADALDERDDRQAARKAKRLREQAAEGAAAVSRGLAAIAMGLAPAPADWVAGPAIVQAVVERREQVPALSGRPQRVEVVLVQIVTMDAALVDALNRTEPGRPVAVAVIPEGGTP